MALVNLPISFTSNILIDIALMIIAATVMAFIFGRLLKQPLIPIYILTGLLIGPVFGIIKGSEEIRLLSELGVAFLLFIVGLELSFRKIKDVGATAFIATIPQIVLVFLVGLYVAQKFFLTTEEAVYLGFILAFSSTMVVVKLLVDRNEINTLHGRIVLGVMLVQDLFVLFVLPALAVKELSLLFLAEIVLKIGGLIALGVLSRFILTPLFEKTARTSEMLLLTSLSSLFVFMMLSVVLELSIIIGAFIAGVALANLQFNVEISSKIKPLRDFFATLFFVSLGLQFVFTSPDKSFYLLLAVLFAIIVILKPLIVFLIVLILGYKERTAFLSGMSIGQISEFSLIIASQAFLNEKIGADLFSGVIILAILTITSTAYLMKLANPVYERLQGTLKPLLKMSIIRSRPPLENRPRIKKQDILILGCHNVGSVVVKKAQSMNKSVFAVDFDPDVIKRLINNRVPCMYGDVLNTTVLEHAGVRKTSVIISTIPEDHVTRYLIRNLKKMNKKAILFVTARHKREAKEYYDLGADFVIYPDMIAGKRVAHVVEELLKKRATPKKIKDFELVHNLN